MKFPTIQSVIIALAFAVVTYITITIIFSAAFLADSIFITVAIAFLSAFFAPLIGRNLTSAQTTESEGHLTESDENAKTLYEIAHFAIFRGN